LAEAEGETVNRAQIGQSALQQVAVAFGDDFKDQLEARLSSVLGRDRYARARAGVKISGA